MLLIFSKKHTCLDSMNMNSVHRGQTNRDDYSLIFKTIMVHVTSRELRSQVFWLRNPTPTPKIFIFWFRFQLRLRKFFICWLRFQLRKTPRFFSLGMSDLSYILVLKFEDAHMDKKQMNRNQRIIWILVLNSWYGCGCRYYLHRTARAIPSAQAIKNRWWRL